MSEINDIKNYYENECDEEERLNSSRMSTVEFLTTINYLFNVCPPRSEILDACAGTGAYAFPLAQKGHNVTAGDLVECNVDRIRKKQESNPILKKIYTGSIMDLSIFENNRFDVVLNFGSFYHLKSADDRAKSISESLRVLKPDGIYCLAYLNRYANYIKYNGEMKDNFDIFEEYIDNGYNDVSYAFYASTPEEVESLMNKFNLKQMHHIATDGIRFVMNDTVDSFSDDVFKRWLNIHYKLCEVKSILGYSEHGLYIGRKTE